MQLIHLVQKNGRKACHWGPCSRSLLIGPEVKFDMLNYMRQRCGYSLKGVAKNKRSKRLYGYVTISAFSAPEGVDIMIVDSIQYLCSDLSAEKSVAGLVK